MIFTMCSPTLICDSWDTYIMAEVLSSPLPIPSSIHTEVVKIQAQRIRFTTQGLGRVLRGIFQLTKEGSSVHIVPAAPER